MHLESGGLPKLKSYKLKNPEFGQRMVQQVEAPVTKPADLSSTPETHKVEETQLSPTVCPLTCTHAWHECIHTWKYIHKY